ncbi:hypothetical protein, partial [Leyella stercorea]|uniref:hypothetical protein n=1 Tax=Leyella stercorea TaxID=363265 RepID=UPI003A945B20
MEKVIETHFIKSAKRQKSAYLTIQKVLIRQKGTNTTILYEILQKKFCNISGTAQYLLPLEKTKIMNSSLYEAEEHALRA